MRKWVKFARDLTDMFLAQIHVPSLNVNILGKFGGVALIAGGQKHGVILGRTFLRHVQMVYDGKTGAVTLTN